jgi:hypothetical protein
MSNEPAPLHPRELFAVGHDVPEWKSGDRVRVLIPAKNPKDVYDTVEGHVRSVTDDKAWVEFVQDGGIYYARIALHRLHRADNRHLDATRIPGLAQIHYDRAKTASDERAAIAKEDLCNEYCD